MRWLLESAIAFRQCISRDEYRKGRGANHENHETGSFLGTYAALQDEVKLTGIAGEWRDLGNHKQFRADTGAVLNWWQSTGTISFQGFAAEELRRSFFGLQRAKMIVRLFRRNCWPRLLRTG